MHFSFAYAYPFFFARIVKQYNKETTQRIIAHDHTKTVVFQLIIIITGFLNFFVIEFVFKIVLNKDSSSFVVQSLWLLL